MTKLRSLLIVTLLTTVATNTALAIEIDGAPIQQMSYKITSSPNAPLIVGQLTINIKPGMPSNGEPLSDVAIINADTGEELRGGSQPSNNVAYIFVFTDVPDGRYFLQCPECQQPSIEAQKKPL